MNGIGLRNVPALLDGESISVDPNWRLRRFPKRAGQARKAIYAMNKLQSTRNGAISQDIVDQCVNFHLSYLPREIFSLIAYLPLRSTANPSRLFQFDLTDERFEYEDSVFYRDHMSFFRNIRDARWTLVPISINENIVLVIIHAKLAVVPLGTWERSIIVQDVAVVYPQEEAGFQSYTYNRLRKILTPERGFIFERDRPINFWYPGQHDKECDKRTCDLRLYEIIRVMITRVSHSVTEGALDNGFNPQFMWGDMNGDFQPDKVRAEMIGILANRAMQFTDWSTRICLVPVREVNSRSGAGILNDWIPAGEDSRLSNLPYGNQIQYNTAHSNTPLYSTATRPSTISPPTVSLNGVGLGVGLGVTPPVPAERGPAPSVSPGRRRKPDDPVPPPRLNLGNGFEWRFLPAPGSDDQWVLAAVPVNIPVASPDADTVMGSPDG